MTARARIVGCGVLAGSGRGVDRFWKAMVAHEPLQALHPLGDHRLDDSRYVQIPEPRDPSEELASHWLALACEDALREAEPVLRKLSSRRVALLGGSSLGGMTLFEQQHRRAWDTAGAAGPGMTTAELPLWRALYSGPIAQGAMRLSQTRELACGGWTINTACSSAANALGIARLWLSHNRCDIAVVAGVDVISPFVYAGFRCLGAMDPEPATPFGAARRGLNLGEAAVALVLVRAADAAVSDESRSIPSSTSSSNSNSKPNSTTNSSSDAVVGASPIDLIGFGSSCDAHHLTRPDLGGVGLARAIRAAIGDAGIEPSQVSLVSAHGTGTPYNDTMEAAAFTSVFGDRVPPLHCAKPVSGHTLGAAGAIDALLVAQALAHGMVPPTYLRGDPDPKLALHPTRTTVQLADNAIALSTSSGFGGSNAALLFTRAEESAQGFAASSLVTRGAP